MRAACADGDQALASGASARRRRAGAGFAPAPPCCANLAQRDAMSWRDHLKIHPAAELFPLMSESELRELGENIKANGLFSRIALYKGKLLDGRNRLDAAELVGGGKAVETIRAALESSDGSIFQIVSNDVDPYEYAVAANLHRRHLTPKKKRELIAKVLKAKPEASNAAVAKQVKADDKTVAKVRGELESRSEIPNVNIRTDSKGRKQPAKRKRRIGKEEKEFHEKYEARKAKMQADWLADHPGRSEDADIAGSCGDTPEGEAAWREWSQKRYSGRDALDTPAGPMLASAASAEVSAEDRRAYYEATENPAYSKPDDGSEAEDRDTEIADPAVIEDNVLYRLQRVNEHARVFKKLFKASTFDREAKERINIAIDRTIQKLRSTQAALWLVPDSTGAGGRPR
jgi:hypothetical protein